MVPEVTVPEVPTVQRFAVVVVENELPFAVPHAPFVGVTLFVAVQFAVVPPLSPVHDQEKLLVPDTLDAVPASQRLVVGADARVPRCDAPQMPFVAVTVFVFVLVFVLVVLEAISSTTGLVYVPSAVGIVTCNCKDG